MGMHVVRQANQLANRLLDRAKEDLDIEAAASLRRMAKVYDVAFEMVHAKTHEHSKNAYAEMIDLIKGKEVD